MKRTMTPFFRTDSSVSPDDVEWGQYGGFEGPLFKGKQKVVEDVKVNTPMLFKALAATAAAESGAHYDAVNMYDAGICSVGAIQVIEGRGVLGVSDLLGEVMLSDSRSSFHELYPIFSMTGYRLSRVDVLGITGKATRFFAPDPEGGIVDTEARVREMLFGSPNVGRKGTWKDENISRAKEWCACIASVFQHPEAITIQRQFIARRLKSYIMGDTEKVLFGDTLRGATDEDMEFFRVVFLSFAVNAPVATSNAFLYSYSKRKDFVSCLDVFIRRMLICGPPFYPDRLRKVLKALSHLPPYYQLISRLDDMLNGFDETGITVKRTQSALKTLGYDIGPSGADGIMGTKTKKALAAFATGDHHRHNPDKPIEFDADGYGEWSIQVDLYQRLYATAESRTEERNEP